MNRNRNTNVLISRVLILSICTQTLSLFPSDLNGKIQSRLTFYSWFTNPLKVPDLALLLFLVHHKNKCVEKPLGVLVLLKHFVSMFFFFVCLFYYFFFSLLILPLITSHEAATLGTTAHPPTGNPCYWSCTYMVGSLLCKRNKWYSCFYPLNYTVIKGLKNCPEHGHSFRRLCNVYI